MDTAVSVEVMVWALLTASLLLVNPGSLQFVRHDIDSFARGYQVAVADMNGDRRPDVIALSTVNNRVDWYENPRWESRPVARTARNIDLAVHDVDQDGQKEIALASGFYFDESHRGGEIFLLSQPDEPGKLWTTRPVAIDPVVHRIRWGDLDGDGRAELVHAPIFGPGSQGARKPQPAHLWALRPPAAPDTDVAPWEVWKVDETLTVLHGLHVSDLDQDGRDEILTASFEGIHRLDFEGRGPARWQKVRISPGVQPQDQTAGAPRGASEVAPGRIQDASLFLAAVEPWHGNQLVVYRGRDFLSRQVVDNALEEVHALVVADFDRDGTDEIVTGWRGGSGGLRLYRLSDDEAFTGVDLDEQIFVEGAVAADINLDGKLDLVVIAGRSNNLVWYENRVP